MDSTFNVHDSDLSGIASQFNTAPRSHSANYACLSRFETSSDEQPAYPFDCSPATYRTSESTAGQRDWLDHGPSAQQMPTLQSELAGYNHPSQAFDYQPRTLEQIVEDNAVASNSGRLFTIAPQSVVLHHDEDPYLSEIFQSSQNFGSRAPSRPRHGTTGANAAVPAISGSDHDGRSNVLKEQVVEGPDSDKEPSRARQDKLIPVARKEKALHDHSTPWSAVARASASKQMVLQDRVDTAAAIVMGAPVEPSVILTCSLCHKVCKDASALRHHERSHDTTITNKNWCSSCSQGFRYPKDLKRHNEAKHPEIATPAVIFQCVQCESSFARKDHYQRHLKSKSHTGSISSDMRSEASVRNQARGAIPQRKLSNMLSPSLTSRSRRRELSYADAVRYGGQLDVMSSPVSESSAVFSQPSSPFPGLDRGTTDTSFDESFLDPRLRSASQILQSRWSSAPGSAYDVPSRHFGPKQR